MDGNFHPSEQTPQHKHSTTISTCVLTHKGKFLSCLIMTTIQDTLVQFGTGTVWDTQHHLIFIPVNCKIRHAHPTHVQWE